MREQPISFANFLDENENPAGGGVNAIGLSIQWQKGPLKDGNVDNANGAFVETVLRACIARMEFYQQSKFKCRENALAITHMQEALHWIQARARDRETRGVYGSHEV